MDIGCLVTRNPLMRVWTNGMFHPLHPFITRFFIQPLNQWDVSNSFTFQYTFYHADSFNQPLDEWDVSNSLDFYFTFAYTENFNQPCLKWSINPDADVRG